MGGGDPNGSAKKGKKRKGGVEISGGDANDDLCFYCQMPGELLCCDGCDRAFHFECLVPPMRKADLPDGEWHCQICLMAKRLQKTSNEVAAPAAPPPMEVPALVPPPQPVQVPEHHQMPTTHHQMMGGLPYPLPDTPVNEAATEAIAGSMLA